MSGGWVVFLKECRDNLRDHRTLTSVLLFGPLLGPALFAILMTTMLRMGAEDIERVLEVPVQGKDNAPSLVAFLEENRIRLVDFEGDPARAVKDGEQDFVLVIPERYARDFRAGRPAPLELYFARSRQRLMPQLSRLRGALTAWEHKMGQLRLMARGIDGTLLRPVVVEEVDVSTPEERGLMLVAMLPYFVLLSILMGGFYLAIDATAGERERGSLEPLLTTAAGRGELLAGKMLATTLFSSVSLAIVLLAFGVSLRFVPYEQIGVALNLDPRAGLLIFMTALPFALVGSALMCLVASFTKSYKEAQTWLSVVLFVPLVPAIVHMIRPFEAELGILATPVLGQQVALLEILAGRELPATALALNLGSSLALAALIGAIALNFYKRERLLG
jgi:sodium transport system permease protein